MECVTRNRNGAEILLDYCSGALDAQRAVEFEQHLAGCGACRRLVETQRELWQTLDRWTAPEVSPRFDARVYARIAQEDSAPLWKQWAQRLLQPAVPVAMWKPAVAGAAICAVLTIGLLVQIPNPAEDVQQMHAEQVDIEQVASALDDLEMLSPGSAM